MSYEYRAIVRDVHDGDTITVDVDLGWNTWRHNESLRLVGLNAPELNTDAGKEARDYLVTLLPVGTEVTVVTEKDHREKYGRMLATVWTGDKTSVNLALIKTGHAVVWDGKGPRP